MITARHAMMFVLGFGTLVIASAWGFQLIGGYQPCGLCYQQRIPYYAGLPVALIAVFFRSRAPRADLNRWLAWAVTLIFAVSVFLAVRHAGVEWQWWLGPSNCGAGGLGGLSQGQSVLEALQTTRVAYCDEAAARFLGLSFAGWNAVASLVLTLAALRAALTKVSG